MHELQALNWLAILVATVAAFMLGGLWYGPLFGKTWLKAIGKTEDELGGAATPMILSFFTSLITAIVMALFIHWLGFDSWHDGLHMGVLVGIGFIATAMASDYAFCGWPRQLFFIQAGYRLVYSIIMGVILCVWQ